MPDATFAGHSISAGTLLFIHLAYTHALMVGRDQMRSSCDAVCSWADLYAGLEVFINSFIKDIGLKPFVLPEGLTVPLTPGRVDGLVVSCAALPASSAPQPLHIQNPPPPGIKTLLLVPFHPCFNASHASALPSICSEMHEQHLLLWLHHMQLMPCQDIDCTGSQSCYLDTLYVVSAFL